MSRLRQCVILWVTLFAVTGVLTAAEPNADELRQKGRELQTKAEKLRSEGRTGEADDVARDADKMFRWADEVARKRGPEGDRRGQEDRGPQGFQQRQSGIAGVGEAIGRQLKALEQYVADLRLRGMDNRAEQIPDELRAKAEELRRQAEMLLHQAEERERQHQPAPPQGPPRDPAHRARILNEAADHMLEAVKRLHDADMGQLAEQITRLAGEVRHEGQKQMPAADGDGPIGRLQQEMGQLRRDLDQLRSQLNELHDRFRNPR